MKVTLTDSYLSEFLKQARYYEFCKDADRALAALSAIWKNIDEPPDITNMTDRQAWEVLLVCGSVISVYGTSNQNKFYQELATDILTRSRETAIKIDDRDLIAETEKQMATAYWRHGQFDNAQVFLNTALSKYSELEQLTNPICLLAQANTLMLYVSLHTPERAFQCIEKIKPFVDDSEDLWLKTGFYNQVGGVYVHCDKFEQAIPFMEKAAEYAAITKNNTYLGTILNNLSNAYINQGNPQKAAIYVSQAINLFLETNQVFPYAQALDTKAQIHLGNQEFEKALLAIDQSISILKEGENYRELCISLWTKIVILIRSGERRQGIRFFNELLGIANVELDLLTGDKYIEKFNELFYLYDGYNLDRNEKDFRRHLLDKALEKCGGMITPTARHLGIDHQRLSKMLLKFPELKEKHRVKMVVRRTDSLKRKKLVVEAARELPSIRLKSDRLNHIGLTKGLIVRFERCPLRDLDLSKPVVVMDKNRKYHCGFLVEAFNMLAFEDGLGNIETTFVESDILDAGQVMEVLDEKTSELIPFEDF